MLKAITTVAAAALLALSSQPSMAVGFGRLVNATVLGQSLDVTVALSADVTEQVTSECVSADVVVGDSLLPHPAVRVRLEPTAGNGARALRVTTTVRIHEPVVSVTVSAACPSRVSRQFVVFVDPPLPAFEASVATAIEVPAAASSPVAVAATVSTPSERVTARSEVATERSGRFAPESEAMAARPTHRATTASASKGAPANSATVRRSKSAGRKAHRASPIGARARSTPRLELERGASALPVAPSTAASAAVEPVAAMSVASTASAAAPSDAERPGEMQRDAMQSMQQRLEKLQTESEAARKSMVQLEARLREAESARSTGWVTYAFTAVGALLLLGIGLLIGRRSSAPSSGATWWNADVEATATGSTPGGALARPGFVASAVAGLPEAVELSDDTSTTDPVPLVITKPSSPELSRTSRVFGDAAVAVGAVVKAEPVSTPTARLTADELIDLDQQAEFFEALGQDDSAVDLLNAFLRGNGGVSQLPYLKLLDIHRRRDERDAYERIRERHDRRFGGSIRRWADEPVVADGIEDHAELIQEIQSAWADPPKAMAVVESLLVGDDRPATPFDLSTLADLQFLYQLARSVRELEVPVTEEASSVDLLLPLSHQDELRAVVAAAHSTQSASERGGSVDSGVSSSSDIDLELDFLPPRADPKPAD